MLRGIWRWLFWGGGGSLPPADSIEFTLAASPALEFTLVASASLEFTLAASPSFDFFNGVGMANPHAGDTGIEVVVRMIDRSGNSISLAGASLLRINFRYDDSLVTLNTASVKTDGLDGRMRIVSTSGTWPRAGNCRIQGYMENGSQKIHCDIGEFEVLENLD